MPVSFCRWRHKVCIMFKYYTTSCIPYIILLIYHQDICIHLTGAAHFKANITPDIYKHSIIFLLHLLTTWNREDMPVSFCRWRQIVCIMFKYYTTSCIPYIMLLIYHQDICIHLTGAAHFKINITTDIYISIVSSSYYIPTWSYI